MNVVFVPDLLVLHEGGGGGAGPGEVADHGRHRRLSPPMPVQAPRLQVPHGGVPILALAGEQVHVEVAQRLPRPGVLHPVKAHLIVPLLRIF